MEQFILISLISFGLFSGCAEHQTNTVTTPSVQQSQDSTTPVEIPAECYDSNGQFDEDLGTDTLDCGNLPR